MSSITNNAPTTKQPTAQPTFSLPMAAIIETELAAVTTLVITGIMQHLVVSFPKTTRLRFRCRIMPASARILEKTVEYSPDQNCASGLYSPWVTNRRRFFVANEAGAATLLALKGMGYGQR